jgi:hypothetical protein
LFSVQGIDETKDGHKWVDNHPIDEAVQDKSFDAEAKKAEGTDEDERFVEFVFFVGIGC